MPNLSVYYALIVVVVLAVQPVFGAGAKVYKWVDSEGNVSYSASPPKDAQAEELQVPTGAPPRAAPADDEAEQAARGEATPTAGDDAIETPEGETAELSPEQQAAERELNQANCKIARQNLKTLNEMPARVLERDAEGNVVRLGDDEIAQRRERALQNIEKFCQ